MSVRWFLASALIAWTVIASAFSAVAGAPAGSDVGSELSLVVPPAPATDGTTFVIFLSGDGGWAELDREVAQRLTKSNLPVVGWNSRAYYWTRRAPEAAADGLERVITRFRAEWKRPRVVLVGYSRGADVLPFLVNRLTNETRDTIALIALLGPGVAIDFEFHLTDWLHDPDPKIARAVVPEIEALAAHGPSLLVIYGDKEKDSPGPALSARLPRVVALPGDHHFGRDYDRLVELILAGVSANTPAP